MIHTGYNPLLVTLSIGVAVFASYTALDLGGRARVAARRGWAWATAAAVAMGGGIWSMHFIGMLAFAMPMPVTYGAGLTVLSLVLAIGATGGAFALNSRRAAQGGAVAASGPLMGAGVAGMHYTGMAAMSMPGDVAFSLPVVALSVLIAVSAATVAMWLTFRQNEAWQKILAACVMGIAVAGMHYTGMAAATFTAVGTEMHAGMLAFDQQTLALYVAGATFVILILAMLVASIDQQRTQGRLRASEARFRAAAEAVGDIIWTNSADGRMRGLQPDWAAYTGQSEAEYQDHGWAEALHPDDVEHTLEAWNVAVKGRYTFVCEHRLRRHDGVYRAFAVRAVPVIADDGVLREWVGVHADITDRLEFETSLKAARDAAEDANRAKSTFIANMSHELRTPLSAIIGYSEMMLEEVGEHGSHADLTPDLRKIENNARHLLGLINDVLDLSKVESGRMETFTEDFDIAEVVRDAAASVGTLVHKKGNRLDVRVPSGLGTMHSDVTKVRQVLLNLLGNAAKFTQDGSIILSVSREAAETVAFRVTDTGIGMSPAQVERLFQRFTQADSSTTRRFGGTGLGLSLTKAFTEMLGGHISVDSSEGQGTSFTVTLPARVTAVAPEPLSNAGAEEVSSRGLVLVIDDDADQRALMTRFLDREGFRSRSPAPPGKRCPGDSAGPKSGVSSGRTTATLRGGRHWASGTGQWVPGRGDPHWAPGIGYRAVGTGQCVPGSGYPHWASGTGHWVPGTGDPHQAPVPGTGQRVPASGTGHRVPGSGYPHRAPGIGYRAAGTRIGHWHWVPGSGYRAVGTRIGHWVPGIGYRAEGTCIGHRASAPGTGHWVPGSGYRAEGTCIRHRASAPGTGHWHQVEGIGYWALGTGHRASAPGTGHWVPGSGYPHTAPGISTGYWALGTHIGHRALTLGIGYWASVMGHWAPGISTGTGHWVPGSGYRALGTGHWVPGTRHQV